MSFAQVRGTIDEFFRSVPVEEPADIAPEVGGLTSSTIRWWLNKLGGLASFVGDAHVEVGCHLGATLLSTTIDNNIREVIAFENYSDTFGNKDVPEQLKANIARHNLDVKLHEEDFFAAQWSSERPVFSYLYDGGHSRDDQYKALPTIWPHAAKVFVAVIDDWNWPQVREGTLASLGELQPRQVALWARIGHRWHNGFAALVIEKPAPEDISAAPDPKL